MKSRGVLGIVFLALLLGGCAAKQQITRVESEKPKRDLIADFGGGDSIRFVGQADNFDCDDPAYASVKKVETATLLFADGTRKRLCKPDSGPAASQETEQIKLSRQYVASRTGVLKIPETARQIKLDPADRQLFFNVVTTEFLKRYGKGANWNPDHPEWKRVAAIMEKDLDEIMVQLAADPRLRLLSKQVDDVFVIGLAARLTSEELRQLIQYYSRPPGAQFVKVQERLSNGLASGMVALQARMMSGQRPVQPQTPPDKNELKELLGLFDEVVRIQWAISDPGPGKDRSGLQAIPMIVGAAVETNFADLIAIWKELPEQDRAAIVAWRDSALGKKERASIFESAKGIRTVFNADAEMSRLAGALAKYETKWRALIGP